MVKMLQKSALVWIIQSILFTSVSGHGRMIDPPQRSSLWRFFPGQGFEPNYNDNELFCGGFAVSSVFHDLPILLCI